MRVGLVEDTVLMLSLRYRPVPYTEAELDSLAARTARGEEAPIAIEGVSRPPVPDDWQAIARSLRSAMEFPPFKLPVDLVLAGQDESIWMRRSQSAGSPDEWVVLARDGEPRGRLRLPAGARMVWSGGDRFWAVELDEYDVPWVVRYRIE